jgi:hypothetical protein
MNILEILTYIKALKEIDLTNIDNETVFEIEKMRKALNYMLAYEIGNFLNKHDKEVGV